MMENSERWGDLKAAYESDEPTIRRYREIRKDRRILNHLIHGGQEDG